LSDGETDRGQRGTAHVREQVVVSPAAQDRILRPEVARDDLEHRNGVVIESADERGALGEWNSGVAQVRLDLRKVRRRLRVEKLESGRRVREHGAGLGILGVEKT